MVFYLTGKEETINMWSGSRRRCFDSGSRTARRSQSHRRASCCVRPHQP